jgi:hypothetical protein
LKIGFFIRVGICNGIFTFFKLVQHVSGRHPSCFNANGRANLFFLQRMARCLLVFIFRSFMHSWIKWYTVPGPKEWA